MRTLQEEFSCIEIGRSSQFRNLTLFPLMRPSVPVPQLDYLLLEDGIAQGKVRVTELHAGGSVPELRLENNADLPVLLVDGEELVGAKQNRVLNLTILAPAMCRGRALGDGVRGSNAGRSCHVFGRARRTSGTCHGVHAFKWHSQV